MSRHERDSGEILGFYLPRCFREAADLPSEAQPTTPLQRGAYGDEIDPLRIERNLKVLRRDRRCPDWFPFQSGLTPREHLDRMNALADERQRQALQIRLAEMETSSRESSARIEADSLEIAKAVKSFTTKWTYVAVGLAAIAVFGTIIGAVFAILMYLR